MLIYMVMLEWFTHVNWFCILHASKVSNNVFNESTELFWSLLLMTLSFLSQKALNVDQVHVQKD